jgi:hypothetical protein
MTNRPTPHLPPGSVPADAQRDKESPGGEAGAFQGDIHEETSRDQGALDAPDTIPRHQSRKVRAAAIVFSYDYGHMFCVLDGVFAQFVTAITGSG